MKQKPQKPREHLPVGNIIWTCETHLLTCVDGHVYWHKREGGMSMDDRRRWGHAFFRCEHCKPPTHFFVNFQAAPDPHATCYLISEDCFKQWANDPSPFTLSTPEMLYLLRDPLNRSYNPYWTPAQDSRHPHHEPR